MSDDPTPRNGYPAQSDPFDSATRRGRLHTPADGTPVLVMEQPSRRNRRRADSSGPIGTLEDRVDSLERDRRAVRRRLWGLLAGVATSIGAVLIWALNAREAAGDEKARLRHLERAVERLESYVYRSASSWRRGYAPEPAAQPDPPAQKE